MDRKGKEVKFIEWKNIKNLKRSFLINLPIEDINKILNTTWVNTQNTNFIFDTCAVKGCNNNDIEIHHVRNLHRSISGNTIIIQGQKKKLKGWEATFSAQKAKQLPLCSEHHKMLHANKLNKNTKDKNYLINN
jgi:hypothetical protein